MFVFIKLIKEIYTVTCLQHRIEEHGERSVTCEDIRLIMPTVLILLFTILVLATVIPYAFSTAIKQLRDLQAREAAGRERERERERERDLGTII